MIHFSKDLKVFLSTEPVDMRKAIDGLCLLVVESLNKNPQDKAIYIFHNKARNKVKAIFWDSNGFMMIYKRLEKGRYQISKTLEENHTVITTQELNWLLSGLDFTVLSRKPDLLFSDYG